MVVYLFQVSNMADVDEIIKEYFIHGYKYKEILSMMLTVHGLSLSIRQLHRKLRNLNLYRKRNQSSIEEGTEFIEQQLAGSGSSVGYRQMHQRCTIYGLTISRKNVSNIMRALDPVGVENRRRRCLRRRQYFSQGPNWVWHMDGYDKLKPYGFSIHGAIDGYSRKILWLDVCFSNKDPSQICSLFIESVNELGAVPRKIVADRGTENVYVAGAQRFLRRHHDDSMAGEKSFSYGRSVSNQRIESWWSMLRRSCTNWWINYFRDLIEQNHFDLTNRLHLECIKFCYLGVIRGELNQMKITWNNHRIRRSITSNSSYRPSGIPNVLYHAPAPEIRDYKKVVHYTDLSIVEETCCVRRNVTYICSDEFFELASIIMEESGLSIPGNASEAFELYRCMYTYR